MLTSMMAKNYLGEYVSYLFYFDCGRTIYIIVNINICAKKLLTETEELCKQYWGEAPC